MISSMRSTAARETNDESDEHLLCGGGGGEGRKKVKDRIVDDLVQYSLLLQLDNIGYDFTQTF